MKKILILCTLLILCVGCTRIDNVEDYRIIIDDIIENGNISSNTTSMGYKYYLPIGVTKVYDKDYNQKFKYEDVSIYLYVDAVSYYYRNPLNFNDSEGDFYYKISNGEKIGYVLVKQVDDNYFLKIVYNYAKIETYVSKELLNEVMANSMIIINSIDYNDNLIKKILEEEYYSSTAEEYKIKKPDDAMSRFSEYLSEYVAEEETVVPDLPEY